MKNLQMAEQNRKLQKLKGDIQQFGAVRVDS